jgi:hypothetical protein
VRSIQKHEEMPGPRKRPRKMLVGFAALGFAGYKRRRVASPS